jgi:hypothetical protein
MQKRVAASSSFSWDVCQHTFFRSYNRQASDRYEVGREGLASHSKAELWGRKAEHNYGKASAHRWGKGCSPNAKAFDEQLASLFGSVGLARTFEKLRRATATWSRSSIDLVAFLDFQIRPKQLLN